MGVSNDPPQSLYPIVQWTIPETKADQVVLDWSSYLTIKWEWDGDRYVRSILGQNGYYAHEVADREGNTQQIAVEVLVILTGNLHDQFPPAGSDGSGVPTTDTLGSGQAWIFSRGAVWEGRWERAEYVEQFRLIGADGADAGVPAGFSWVSVFPDDRTVTWE